MKKLLLLTSALLVCTAAVASAQINLAWKNCLAIATSAANQSYACDGSLGGAPSFKLVPSFVTPASPQLTKFVGMQATIDVQTSDPTLPDFWKLAPGECRAGTLVFPAGLTGVGNTTTCRNPWGGNTGGGYQWTSNSTTVNRGRLKLAFSTDTEQLLLTNQQYIGGAITIDPYGDVDLGDGIFCAGCSTPACIVMNDMELFQTVGTPGGDIFTFTAPATRQYVTWQGGGIGGNGCPAATPTHNKTWGSVKALYR